MAARPLAKAGWRVVDQAVPGEVRWVEAIDGLLAEGLHPVRDLEPLTKLVDREQVLPREGLPSS